MKFTHGFWKLATVGMILACICFVSVVNVFAIDTPWIDMSQVTTEEESSNETQPSQGGESTTTPSQGTNDGQESEKVTDNTQATPSDDGEATVEQTDGQKTPFGGCKSAVSMQTEGCLLLAACVLAMACVMKKQTSHNA